MKIIFFILLILISIFLRFYHLDLTARFTRDESSDLVAIKNIFDHQKITLIGPMDEGGVEVFSSMTYYLLLPFCVIFGFSPLVTAAGTAFYGSLTIIFFALILKKIHWSYLIFILSIIFTPLLVSSRWAWNPHFVPFWQVISLLILFSNLPLKYFLVGVFMGLTIHQHWYAVFTVIALIPVIYELKFKNIWQYLLGVTFTILPFIIFDLTHPPGLFITRMLYFSPLATGSSSVSFFQNLWLNTTNVFRYFSGNQIIFGFITITITLLFLLIHRTKNNLWLLPLLFQIVGLSLTHSPYRDHYLLPSAIFYLFWLYKNQKHLITLFLTILLIIFNLLNLSTILNSSDWNQNIRAQQKIVNYIGQNQLNNPSFNLAVLQSPDSNTKALRFKDQLKLINILPKDPAEYAKIDTLYIISYQSDWTKLSADPAYELDKFRTNSPLSITKIVNSDWYLYKLAK